MISRLFAIIALVLVTGGAQAETIIWNAPGAACVPNATSVKNVRNFGAASVGHLGVRTGALVFTCAIERFDTATDGWVLGMAYRDSTGTGTAASVVVRLYRLPKTGFVPIQLAALSSNAFTATGNAVSGSTNSFTHLFNFDANAYFIRVSITRGAKTQVARLHSVWIEEK
jgi:hypothetical protein